MLLDGDTNGSLLVIEEGRMARMYWRSLMSLSVGVK
jgi:hypothetical protein